MPTTRASRAGDEDPRAEQGLGPVGHGGRRHEVAASDEQQRARQVEARVVDQEEQRPVQQVGEADLADGAQRQAAEQGGGRAGAVTASTTKAVSTAFTAVTPPKRLVL